MRKIVFTEPTDSINFSKLTGFEIIAYRCHNSNNIAILSRVSGQNKINEVWGFIPFGEPMSNPRFSGSSWENTIKLASKNRQLLVFNSKIELANYIISISK